jgi:hypothetical protein
MLAIFNNLRELMGNNRADRIFRIVAYGTIFILLGFFLFLFVLFVFVKSLKWTDATGDLVGLIILIISLISIVVLFELYALQPKNAVPIPLLSSGELRHRRILTWTSVLTLVCLVFLILSWVSSEKKLDYFVGLLPVYLSYGFIVLRLYSGSFRAGLKLAIAMGSAFGIASVYLIRYLIRWDKNWLILGILAIATLLQTVLVVVATKTLIGMPGPSKWRIRSLGSFAYGAVLVRIFLAYYSPVPSYISENEYHAMMYLSECKSLLFYFSQEHDRLFPTNFSSSESTSNCIPTAPSVIDTIPDLSNPINGYIFEYSGEDVSRSADGCTGFERIAMTARPVVYEKTGVRSFTIIESSIARSSVIYSTSENRPATANDPIVSFPHRP